MAQARRYDAEKAEGLLFGKQGGFGNRGSKHRFLRRTIPLNAEFSVNVNVYSLRRGLLLNKCAA